MAMRFPAPTLQPVRTVRCILYYVPHESQSHSHSLLLSRFTGDYVRAKIIVHLRYCLAFFISLRCHRLLFAVTYAHHLSDE